MTIFKTCNWVGIFAATIWYLTDIKSFCDTGVNTAFTQRNVKGSLDSIFIVCSTHSPNCAKQKQSCIVTYILRALRFIFAFINHLLLQNMDRIVCRIHALFVYSHTVHVLALSSSYEYPMYISEPEVNAIITINFGKFSCHCTQIAKLPSPLYGTQLTIFLERFLYMQ